MDPRVVTELPVLDQAKFPALPTVPEGTAMLRPFESTLGRSEYEAVLGVLVTAAARAGTWKPVSTPEFIKILRSGVEEHLMMVVVNAVWELAGTGVIEMLRLGENDYVVPSPAFAAHLNGCDLRYISDGT